MTKISQLISESIGVSDYVKWYPQHKLRKAAELDKIRSTIIHETQTDFCVTESGGSSRHGDLWHSTCQSRRSVALIACHASWLGRDVTAAPRGHVSIDLRAPSEYRTSSPNVRVPLIRCTAPRQLRYATSLYRRLLPVARSLADKFPIRTTFTRGIASFRSRRARPRSAGRDQVRRE